MKTFNNIGISDEFDYQRTVKLLKIGLFASLITLVADLLLGYVVPDFSLSGLEFYLSGYANISDSRIFWSALLGLIGISLEGLSYFGIYRLIAPKSEHYAHGYRTGIIGYLLFGPVGVHVMCMACVYIYKYMLQADPENALAISIKFGSYFLLPTYLLFFITFIILNIYQIRAILTGNSMLPKWCAIINVPIGMIIPFIIGLFDKFAICNAISAAWISFGNIYLFLGLLICCKKYLSKL